MGCIFPVAKRRKGEIRKPKTETRKKPEIRSPKRLLANREMAHCFSTFGFMGQIALESGNRYWSPPPGVAALPFLLLPQLALKLLTIFVGWETLAHQANCLHRFIELSSLVKVKGIGVAVLGVLRP
jgi:hypothetical protein